MELKTFTNINNLSKRLILLRLEELDPDITIEVFDMVLENNNIHHHLGAYSSLDYETIAQAISTPATPDELSNLNNAATSVNRVANIPNWATWTEQDAIDWWTANLSDAQVDAITSLADAKELLKKQNAAIAAFARMLLAMRDKLWPNL